SMYTQEQRIDGNSKIPGRITMGGTDLPSIETSRALLQQHLTGFVDQLVGRGLKVVLVGQVPPHALNPNYCLLRTMRAGRANVDACGIESARAQKHLAYSNQMLQAIAADRPDVYAVLPSAHLCAGRYCKTMLNDEPLYKDYNHLTAGGAAALYDLLPFDALSF
ncbi:MAG: SGNH hydrolase domain-containing protein, partial [Alphaproteobacteria bacterium]